MSDEPDIHLEWIGGNCPVQAEGTINGKPFYFRARGDHWSLGVGNADPVGAPEWVHEEIFGSWPDAGWITEEQALKFLRAAARRYHAGEPAKNIENRPGWSG